MEDLLGRIDTAALYQPFCEKLNGLLNACAARGAIYVATTGLRTYDEQARLYAKGRDASGKIIGSIVTKAKPGYSPHQFGVGVDFAKHKGSEYLGKLDPDYADASYQILAEEAVKLNLDPGLFWKGDFQDSPHVQLPLKKAGVTWAKLRELYAAGGYPKVFAFLDRYAW